MSATWLNGRLVDEAEAVVSVRDRGFLLGDGLFETMRAYGGRVFALNEHLERLRRGAARIGLALPDGVEDAIPETLAASGLTDAAVRLTVTRGCAEREGGGLAVAVPSPQSGERVRVRGGAVAGSSAATTVITVRDYEPLAEWYDRGLRAGFAPGRLDENRATAGLKHLGYLEAILALRHAQSCGWDDALFLDTAGHVAEATASNVFALVDDMLITPPLTCGVLPGITRATVLRLAAERGHTVREEPIAPETLTRASEAFLTSSLREIVPLVAINGEPIGDGRPGPIARGLVADYREVANP